MYKLQLFSSAKGTADGRGPGKAIVTQKDELAKRRGFTYTLYLAISPI
jgi:hypothetical protein